MTSMVQTCFAVCCIADISGGYYMNPFWAAVFFPFVYATMMIAMLVVMIVSRCRGKNRSDRTMTPTQKHVIHTAVWVHVAFLIISVAMLWRYWVVYRTPGAGPENIPLPYDQSVEGYFDWRTIGVITIVACPVIWTKTIDAVFVITGPKSGERRQKSG